MVAHMKTTIDISDALFRQAKLQAHAQGRTLRELVEEGLRQVLAEKPQKRIFRLEDRSFKGRGLQPGIREGDWDTIHDLAYGLRREP